MNSIVPMVNRSVGYVHAAVTCATGCVLAPQMQACGLCVILGIAIAWDEWRNQGDAVHGPPLRRSACMGLTLSCMGLLCASLPFQLLKSLGLLFTGCGALAERRPPAEARPVVV